MQRSSRSSSDSGTGIGWLRFSSVPPHCTSCAKGYHREGDRCATSHNSIFVDVGIAAAVCVGVVVFGAVVALCVRTRRLEQDVELSDGLGQDKVLIEPDST